MATKPAAPIGGGWVFKKKGGAGGWKKQWGIMYGSFLHLFDSPESMLLENAKIDVTGAKCVPVKSQLPKLKWVLETKAKEFLFYVEADQDRNQWVNALRQICEGKVVAGQLMEKPQLVTADGTHVSGEEARRLAKKGKQISVAAAPVGAAPGVPAGFTRAKTTLAPGQTGLPGQPTAKNPYEIHELISPKASTSSVLGKQLKWEEEEKRRDEQAAELAKERNTFGGGEMNDDDNDWLVEEENPGFLGNNCSQQ